MYAWPVLFAVAAVTLSVMSVMSSSRWISMSGHGFSSPCVAAQNPSLTKSWSFVDSPAMHSCAQWWLVITRPVSDTKLAEQMPAMRADALRALSSHG